MPTNGSDEAQNTPEQVARALMEAVRIRDYHQAGTLTARALEQKEFDILASLMSTLYGADPDRMTEFAEVHRKGAHAVARISSPPGKLDLKPSLVLKRSGKTWGILAGPFPSAAGTSSAEELERVRAEFRRDESGDSGAAIEVGKGESVVRSVQLPDADRKDVPVILDLASGDLPGVPVEGAQEIIEHVDKLGKGDLAWDKVLVTLRGANQLCSDL